MARRTKEQALATRSALLDAAEQLFLDQGVSRTTLQDVALAAGVTRGAVYWHFADKGALFNAMLERVLLPLEAADALFEPDGSGLPPLQGLQQHLHDVFARALSLSGILCARHCMTTRSMYAKQDESEERGHGRQVGRIAEDPQGTA